MRKDFGVKPWLYPQPVLIIGTYDEEGKPNAMNAAWGGMSEENQISICISANHKTTKNILLSKAFTVSMADENNVVGCDFVGIVSGNKDNDKFNRAGFTASKSKFVNAPIINELKMTLECNLIDYNEDTCILRGQIMNISADESVLDEKGNIDPTKLKPIIFDPVNLKYLGIKGVVGNAFRDGKKVK